MSSLYLNEELHPDAFAVGARLPVRGADARHATQVARIRTAERVAVGDGRGRIAWGPVTHIGQGEFAITADEIVIEAPKALDVWLVQALAKGDRDELAVQAATELGVSGVIPWQAARSVSRWDGPKAEKGVERWRAIVREAAKQAIRATVPEVGALMSTRTLVEELGPAERLETSLMLILEPTAPTSLAEELGGAERLETGEISASPSSPARRAGSTNGSSASSSSPVRSRCAWAPRCFARRPPVPPRSRR